MTDWNDILWLFSQPAFWAITIFSIILKKNIKYLRFLYPKKMQNTLKKEEDLFNKVNKDPKDKKILQKVNNIQQIFFLLFPFILFCLYLFYSFFIGIKFTPYFIKNSIVIAFGTPMFIIVGIFTINQEKIYKYFLKDNYTDYLELENRLKHLKNPKFTGYIFLLIGIASFIISI